VKFVVDRVAISLPTFCDKNDIYSSGVLGLIDAVDKYDPESGVKFETYASSRVRGAILDGLRSLDWVPRSVRRKVYELQSVFYELEHRMGRTPSDTEVAQELDLSMEEYNKLVTDASFITLVSLDEIIFPEEGAKSVSLADMVPDKESRQPLSEAATKEAKEIIVAALQGLPEQERIVLALYYYEEMTLKEIGLALELTESRVSQIHTKAIIKLRARMKRWKEKILVT